MVGWLVSAALIAFCFCFSSVTEINRSIVRYGRYGTSSLVTDGHVCVCQSFCIAKRALTWAVSSRPIEYLPPPLLGHYCYRSVSVFHLASIHPSLQAGGVAESPVFRHQIRVFAGDPDHRVSPAQVHLLLPAACYNTYVPTALVAPLQPVHSLPVARGAQRQARSATGRPVILKLALRA